MSHRQLSGQRAQRWAPDLGAARLVGAGRTTAMLRRDDAVRWWCAPDSMTHRCAGSWTLTAASPLSPTSRISTRTPNRRVSVRIAALGARAAVAGAGRRPR
jgi:hypothetical protein